MPGPSRGLCGDRWQVVGFDLCVDLGVSILIRQWARMSSPRSRRVRAIRRSVRVRTAPTRRTMAPRLGDSDRIGAAAHFVLESFGGGCWTDLGPHVLGEPVKSKMSALALSRWCGFRGVLDDVVQGLTDIRFAESRLRKRCQVAPRDRHRKSSACGSRPVRQPDLERVPRRPGRPRPGRGPARLLQRARRPAGRDHSQPGTVGSTTA